jgi:glycogen debranching enzyme
MSTTEPQVRTPASMEEAVGYVELECHSETAVEGALVLKHDRLFLLVDGHGDVAPPGRCGLGLFPDDTRILSEYALKVAGGPPSQLGAQIPQVFRAQIDLAVTDLPFGGAPWDPKNSVHLRREILLDDRLVERVTLTSYLPRAVDYWMELAVGSDFADIFELRGFQREGRGQFYAPRAEGDHIEMAYRGRDGALIGTCVRFAEPPTRVEARRARWEMRLEPGRRWMAEWEVASVSGEAGWTPASMRPHGERQAALTDDYAGWRAECSQWETDVAEFDATLHRAVDDLRALYVEADGERIVSAGIPWYSTAFGRDSIITSLQTLAVNPEIAVDTLRYLARHQGEKEDPFTEEQPGKIMHELRRGELARAGEIPHVPYYGTVDATPLWLILLHETWRWTGDHSLVRELLPHAERALDWMDRYGDLDGDGLIEYHRVSEKGLANQGWKDSGDGVPFPDGTLPEPPIALVEVQGYAYDARVRTAALFEAAGRGEDAARLRERAERLREEVVRRFWLPERGTFALALDGRKRPLDTVTTNAGHLLWSRLPDAEQARRMAGVLLGPEMFSGWGIRTLSAEHPVYNPMSYHNGSIWPHDNAIVLMGLALYGWKQEALPVVSALHDAAANMKFHRLPELFCGMRRGEGMRPVLYPVSCSPQAWASGALFMIFQAVTGLLPDVSQGVLHIREPALPPFLRELRISNLRIGGSRVSLEFRRRGERTLANVLDVEGAPLKVWVEF